MWIINQFIIVVVDFNINKKLTLTKTIDNIHDNYKNIFLSLLWQIYWMYNIYKLIK